jgi:signal transduction histidine kinase
MNRHTHTSSTNSDSAPKTASRRMRARLCCVLVGGLLAVGLAGATSAQDEVPGRKKQVVVLYSFKTLMPVNVERDRGIRRALAEEFGESVDLDIEHLDLSRYGDAEYVHDWIVLLQRKYAGRKIDLLMPVASHAIQFALAHRAELFPNVPIVFCSAGVDLAERACAEPNVTGVAYRFGADETLRAALDIYPKAERLLVICGASNQDKSIHDLATSVVAQYEQTLDIDYLVGLPLPELLDRVTNIDPHTVVLILTFNKDARGNNYVTREVVERASEVCPAPVFGLWDTLLGHGIAGGSLIPIEMQGELAGRMAARVLRGERPSEIPVAGLEINQLMFDARQLRRFGIPEDILPAGSILRYREATFYEKYGAYFVAGLLILALQSIVIAGLLVNRARRQRAEREARQLAGRLLTAQEDESKRLARELHDDLSQRLAVTAIETGKLEQQTADSSESQARLGNLKNTLVTIADDVHQISRQIHPAILDDLGLEDALRSECSGFGERHGVAVQFRCGELPEALPNDVALCLYRIVQEALRNVAKHAMTDGADVVLRTDSEFAYLEVHDSGCGFDPCDVQGKLGLGLASMEERARLVGGNLTLSSEPGRGTSITVRVPMPEENA